MNKREHVLGTLLDLPHGMYVQEPDGTLRALLVHWHFVQVPGLKCEVQATHVTQEQWVQVMGTNPSENQHEKCLPVEWVSYDDILVYLDKLNKTRNDGYVYRLPTEEEHEVALGGLDKVQDLEDYAWYYENSQGRTHQVGTKKANEYGLYDMLGNLFQTTSTLRDPCCSYRVVRGSAFHSLARFLHSANRDYVVPEARDQDVGLRLVRTKV